MQRDKPMQHNDNDERLGLALYQALVRMVEAKHAIELFKARKEAIEVLKELGYEPIRTIPPESA